MKWFLYDYWKVFVSVRIIFLYNLKWGKIGKFFLIKLWLHNRTWETDMIFWVKIYVGSQQTHLSETFICWDTFENNIFSWKKKVYFYRRDFFSIFSQEILKNFWGEIFPFSEFNISKMKSHDFLKGVRNLCLIQIRKI